MKFLEIAKQFSLIEAESSRTNITALLAELLAKATPSEAAIIAYLSLGELNPVYIGTKFNIAEKSMAAAIARVLDTTQAAITLRTKHLGDMGLVVAEGTWRRNDGDLSLAQVNRMLHEIEGMSGVGSQEAKEEALAALLGQLEPQCAKYVVRIILGKLRLGFSDMTLLDAFSWMVAQDKSLRAVLEHAYNVSVDIGNLVKVLKIEGAEGVASMHITPGIPIRPAAAERLADAKAIIEKIGPCIAQPKLDGFRLQVHIDAQTKNPNINFYSRNLADMSQMFPELKAAVASLKVETAVLEGEAIAYDVETGVFLPFQETVKRRRKHGIAALAEEVPLKLYFFDALFLDGSSLLDLSHQARRKRLISVIDTADKAAKQILFVDDEKKIESAKELEEYFNETITRGLEGLVVKKPNGHYLPGKRNFNWIKLKRQEGGHLEDTIDCVILGYYAGHGKRANFGIGAFLVGVFNKKEDRFETVAKIGTGLSDKGWQELKEKCDQLALKNRPHNVLCAKELAPDVWTSPEIVCAIRADEITLSPMHSAGATKEHLGYALRFPRFMAYRVDKSSTDATTIQELASLYELQFVPKKKKRGPKT